MAENKGNEKRDQFSKSKAEAKPPLGNTDENCWLPPEARTKA